MIGQTISHYKILEKLGEGGMGVVYKAEDLKLKRHVAIKFLAGKVSLRGEERERMRIEAQAAAALNHPNIATIHTIEEVDGETFIVMEFVEGVELKEKIAQGPLPVDDVTRIAVQMAEGLKAAHAKGIVHRDIKSGNIMLTPTGQVKIMDFGLAKVGAGSQVTKVGTTVGTIAYMSPEQARGDEVDHRSDLWSFGVVLYEMLTGRLPFKSDYEQAVVYAILNEEPPPVAGLRPDVPRNLHDAVSLALTKDPSKRAQATEELLTLLRNQQPDAGSMGFVPASAKQKVSSFRPWHATTLFVLLAAVFGTWYFFFRPTAEAIDTLAILPFTNQSNDEEMEYLSSGLAETLIFKLSQLPNLKVRSLNSVLQYRGGGHDLQKVGSDLKVRAVLTGRVNARKDRLAIVVELVDTKDNSTIWGDTYNRPIADVISVQDEISSNVLTRLRFELTDEARRKVGKSYTDNADAFQAYLKGRHFVQRRTDEDLKRALDYYQQAIALAPRHALAYAGIAQTHFLRGVYNFIPRDEAYTAGRRAAEEALGLDAGLSEAHVALGLIQNWNGNYAEATASFKRAIEFDPNNADARHHYSYNLSSFERYKEAIREGEVAIELEPLSPVMSRGLALVLLFAREYDRSRKYFHDCLETDPHSLSATFNLVFVYDKLGKQNEAIATLARYLELIREEKLSMLLKEAYARLGYRAALMQLLGQNDVGFWADPSVKAGLYGIAGDNGRALQSLEKGFETRSPWFLFADVHPALDSVRSDPRFVALMQQAFKKK